MGRTKRQYASRFHSKSALFTLSQGSLAALAAILSYITRKKNIFSDYWNSSLQDFLSMFMHSLLCQTISIF
jgi:hypothetical protein